MGILTPAPAGAVPPIYRGGGGGMAKILFFLTPS